MRTSNGWALPLALFCISIFGSVVGADAQTTQTPRRITQPIDEKHLVALQGNVHPLALAKYDQGAVSDAQPLHRMLLLLQRGPDQEAALQKLLDDQQDKSSPNYHAWLTPQQFGQQFGPSDADIQTVTNWLQSHGLQVTNVSAGRTLLEFSGTAGQVRSAFHTAIHKYLVNGELHTANAGDPQIPAALAPVVVGPVSLNSFPISSHLRQLGTFRRAKDSNLAIPLDRPLYTFPGCTPAGCFGLGPADFATIYNSAPLLTGTPKIDGTGQTIAIVGESDINPSDVTDFQTMFGMTPNFSAANNVIVNGADPGVNATEGESDLDVQWAGAVAPGATIKFVTSQPTETTAGTLLSAVYIVENNLAGVLSESFGGCEQQIGTLNQFHNSLWEQAAAQGITVILSAGDGGSAGCDNFDTAQTASQGLAVSGFASTPYNVAVGGTDFDEINKWSQYWSSTNNSTNQSSALSYIPEIPWNENCAQLGLTGCGASAPNGSLNIVAGSGGVSTIYSKPSWQSGIGVPNDGHRDLPDLSLFASPGFDGSFYIICQKDVVQGEASCNLTTLGFTFQGVGGTSASAPAFAGIMALVNQSQATASIPAPRQGNANYVLYALFNKQSTASPAINCNSSATPSASCTFYDVTRGNSGLPAAVGTNSVPCAPGSPNCSSKMGSGTNGVLVTPTSSTTEAYTVATGYDLATGLGSVNIANLVKNWSAPSAPSTTTLTATLNGQSVTSITGITHGTPVSVSSSVAAGSGATGTPSGAVALLATPNPTANAQSASLGFDLLSLINGTATGTNIILPGGQYNLTAHYQGDGTFGPSDSTPPISVNISAEPSKTFITVPVFNPSTGAETTNQPTSVVYGTPYIARVDVGNANASLATLCSPPICPTGTITWTDAYNAAAPAPLDGGTLTLNSSGFTEDQAIQLPGGTHQLSASYNGNSSFGSSSATYNLSVTPAPTTTGPGNPPLPPLITLPFGINAIVSTQSSGVMPSCNITVLDGNTPLSGTPTCTGQNGTANSTAFSQPSLFVTQATSGTHTYTFKFNGDANYAPSSTVMVTHVLNATTVSVTATPSTVQYGSSVTLTALVDTSVMQGPAISDSVSFRSIFNPVSGTVTYTPTTDASGNVALQAALTITPQFSTSYTATFSGDSNYASNQSPSVAVNVNIPQFSVAASPNTLTLPAGQSGTATITVTPASSASSPVALSVQPGSLPAGATATFAPSNLTLAGGNPATSTFTLTTLPPSTTNTVGGALPAYLPISPRRPWIWVDVVVLALAVLAALSLGLNLPRRRWAVFGSAAACILWIACGCGGGGVGSSGGGGGQATPSSISLGTSAIKVPVGTNVTLTAQVMGKNPTGSVNFLVQGGTLATVPLQPGGTATVQVAFNIGTTVLGASYSGDANNLPSQTSGSLNQVVTGTLLVTVNGTTGGLVNQATIQVTIQ